MLSKEPRLLICVTPVIISKQSDSFNKPIFCRERGSCISWIRRESWHLPARRIPPACGGAESKTAAPVPPEHPSEPGSSNQPVPKQHSLFPRLCMPVSFPLPLLCRGNAVYAYIYYIHYNKCSAVRFSAAAEQIDGFSAHRAGGPEMRSSFVLF